MEFSLNCRNYRDVAVLECKGRLLGGTSTYLFCETLNGMLVEHRRVIVNLENVSEMDCAAVGALAACLQKAQDQGRILRGCGAQGIVREVLELTGLEELLQEYESENVAVAAVRTCAA